MLPKVFMGPPLEKRRAILFGFGVFVGVIKVASIFGFVALSKPLAWGVPASHSPKRTLRPDDFVHLVHGQPASSNC